MKFFFQETKQTEKNKLFHIAKRTEGRKENKYSYRAKKKEKTDEKSIFEYIFCCS